MRSTAGDSLDLNRKEQAHVRAALQFLRRRTGGWETLAKALRIRKRTLAGVATGEVVTPVVAFRVAKFAKVTVDDVLTGKFPSPNACPYCGHQPAEASSGDSGMSRTSEE